MGAWDDLQNSVNAGILKGPKESLEKEMEKTRERLSMKGAYTTLERRMGKKKKLGSGASTMQRNYDDAIKTLERRTNPNR